MTIYQQHLTQLQNTFEQGFAVQNCDACLIYSGQLKYGFQDDNNYPFKVHPYFKYWLPLTTQVKSFLFIAANQRPVVFLFQQEDYWHAQPVVPEGEWREHFELVIIKHTDEVKTALQGKLNSCAFIGEETELVSDWGLQSLNPEPLLNHLDYYRAYKSEYEIESMAEANKLAAKAHIAAREAFYAGKSELSIHLDYLAALNVRESKLPYNNIIALNHHSAVLHYDDYESVSPKQRLSFLIDAGAEYNGFCADITRSYAAQAGLYDELNKALEQQYFGLVDEIKLNGSYTELHDSMHKRISTLLHEFNLINLSSEEIYEQGYSQLFFPHGVGHHIGAQVHDVGGHLASPKGDKLAPDSRYPFLRLLRPIEENTVFTIEPGLYVVDQLLRPKQGDKNINWQRIDELRPYGGVRVEDCIAVTKQGLRNLSREGFSHFEK